VWPKFKPQFHQKKKKQNCKPLVRLNQTHTHARAHTGKSRYDTSHHRNIKNFRNYFEKLYVNKVENFHMHGLPKMNQKDIKNLNRLITNNETDLVDKVSQQRKAQDQISSLENYLLNL
jgi:hypothetical protein